MTADDLVTEAANALPTDLGELLDGTERFIRRFIAFQSDDQAAAVVLFVAHCYSIAAAPAAAYLRVTSAVEESGKSTLLEVLRELLGSHAIGGESISPSTVFRTRDKIGPVALLLDEIDNTLRDRKDEGARDLLAVVNAGYRRAATAWRVVGREHEPRQFRAFGPCVITGLGSLAATTESRCIPIVLERKDRGSGERWLPFRLAGEISAIAERLEAWATRADVIDALRAANPAIPPELRDRQAETWWGLLAIADAAGEPWSSRARVAAVSLHTGRDAEDSMSLSVLLLSHIRRVFTEASTDRIPTIDLLRALVDLEEGPWARWWAADVEKAERSDGPPPRRAGAELSHKLKPFRRPDGERIKPHPVKMDDGRVPRGYYVSDFADAFPRYLGSPDATDVANATALARMVATVAPVASPGQQGAEPPDGRCPECGARSAVAGYGGHGMHCSRYYRSEAAGA